jgi:hypothetical protein
MENDANKISIDRYLKLCAMEKRHLNECLNRFNETECKLYITLFEGCEKFKKSKIDYKTRPPRKPFTG